MSTGEKDVSIEEIDDVGDALLRILERVDRNLRRNLCGRITGMEGQDIGIVFNTNALETSSRNGAYEESCMKPQSFAGR